MTRFKLRKWISQFTNFFENPSEQKKKKINLLFITKDDLKNLNCGQGFFLHVDCVNLSTLSLNFCPHRNFFVWKFLFKFLLENIIKN